MSAKPRVIIGCDHAAVPTKHDLSEFLKAQGYTVENMGVDTTASVDYPDIAAKVCAAVVEGLKGHDMSTPLPVYGILICGTGIGMSMAANKFPGIRAALVHEHYSSRMSRWHNNANVICFGARTTGVEVIKEAAMVFLTTDFEGGKHAVRVNKIHQLEAPATPAA